MPPQLRDPGDLRHRARVRRAQPAADGRPRLFLFRGSLVERDEDLAMRRLPVCTEQEFEVYSWPKAADGRPGGLLQLTDSPMLEVQLRR